MNGRMKAAVVMVAAGATMAVVGTVVTPAAAGKPSPEKVTICHGTNSETNPYTQNEVSVDAVDGQGQNDHSHHTGPVWYPGAKADNVVWGDIIPPVEGVTPGLNWSADGQAIWNNGCNVPQDPPVTDPPPATDPPPVTDPPQPGKVTICHGTNSETNPYTQNEVSVDAVDGQGQNDHSHHTGPVWYPGAKADNVVWGDIIPPVEGVTPGLNWTAEGQAIWNNGCNVPQDPPTTDPPVTDPPVTDPPVTDPPVTDPPVTDPPVTDPPKHVEVTICHATHSETNPYVTITVDDDAVDGQGENDHSHHTGPVWYPGAKDDKVDWGDIIPPVTGVTEGLNWDEAGQYLWEHDCNISLDDFTAAAVCHEVDVQGATTLEWYDITNPNDKQLTVYWADGHKQIAAGATERVSTAGPGITLKIDGNVVGGSDDSGDVCTRTVKITKQVEGTPEGTTYTVTISRRVGAEYVSVATADVTAGGTVSVDLPSGLVDGFDYVIEETSPGGAQQHTVEPGLITLNGNLGESVSVVITNYFASISLDKQTSATTVAAGGSFYYTLQAHNTGGLALHGLVVEDNLPDFLTVTSATVADSGGTCTVTKVTLPQKVECELTDPLPVGGYTKLITINVSVSLAIPATVTLENVAKVVGYYTEPLLDLSGPFGSLRTISARTPAVDNDPLSCTPLVTGAVCDVSAKIGVTITPPPVITLVPTTTTAPTTTLAPTTTTTSTTIEQLLPTTTEAPTSVAPEVNPPASVESAALPTTGSGVGALTLLGLVLVTIGAALLAIERRSTAAR